MICTKLSKQKLFANYIPEFIYHLSGAFNLFFGRFVGNTENFGIFIRGLSVAGLTVFRTILLLGLFGGCSLYAQEVDSTAAIEETLISIESAQESTRWDAMELEIGQLIIDNTFSKAGSDFQQMFYTRWNWPPQEAEQFIITLSEKPSFVNSTIIEISINDLKVYESFLQPRYDILEMTVDQAIDVTLQYILNYEEVVKELSGDDLSGSGIY